MGMYNLTTYGTYEIVTILRVIKDKRYADFRDLRQFAEMGIPILSHLIEYYSKINGIEFGMLELYSFVEDKQVSYNDIIDALKDKGYKNIEL